MFRHWAPSLAIISRRTLPADASPAHQARRGAHPPVRAPRRADLRSQLRRAGRGARARRQRRARARDRPLRDRRAPDLRLRHPHGVAARDGPDGLAPPDLRPARDPHALRHLALRAALDLLDVRLPRAVPAALGAVRAASRPPRSTAAAATWCTPTAATSARRSSSTRWLAPRARHAATSRPTRRSRADSRCTRTAPARRWSSGSTAATCRPGYGWSFPAGDELRIGVGSFDPRFHVKDTTVLLAEDLGRDAVRYQGNWIPHKLRAASEDGVFFVATRPATACRSRPRASAPRSTSASPAGASSARCSRAATAAAGAAALWRLLGRLTSGSSTGCCGPARGAPGPAAATRPGDPSDGLRSASWTGPSGTTWTSRRRSSPEQRHAHRWSARGRALAQAARSWRTIRSRRGDIRVSLIHMNSSDAARRPYRMTARAETAAATGERILDAAEELFWSRPLHKLHLQDVAAGAGVTVQTIIRRFGSKNGWSPPPRSAPPSVCDRSATGRRWGTSPGPCATSSRTMRRTATGRFACSRKRTRAH